LTAGLLCKNIELKKEMQFIELPRLPQQTTKKGEFLSVAKDYFGYKGKRVVVTGAASGMGDAATKRYIIGAGVIGTGELRCRIPVIRSCYPVGV